MSVLRSMMLTDIEDYIQKGLVFQLCGEDATEKTWISRIGNKEFTLNNCTLGDMCVIFNGTNSFCQSPIFSYNTSGHTIQFVFKTNNYYSYQIIFLSPVSDSIAAGILTSGGYLWSANTRHNYPKSNQINTNIKTVSISEGSYYENETTMTSIGSDYWTANGSYTYIGKRYDGAAGTSFLNGSLYQIRIYDRILEPEEILYNQKLDIGKYNITL